MVNSKNIKDLNPIVQEKYKQLEKISKEKGINIILTCTYRDFEYQNFLYNQKPKITNARGGQSYHNFWLAFDICVNDKENAYNKHLLNQVGIIGENLGLEWGGRFRGLVDMPHFQLTFGKTLAELKKMKKEEIFGLK